MTVAGIVLDINLNGAFLLAVLPIMQRGWPHRISHGAFVICAHPLIEGRHIAMTKPAAKEFAADGILVNAIAPLPLRYQAALLKLCPREIADYLVSDRLTYVSGAAC